jgi:hypothetical protein
MEWSCGNGYFGSEILFFDLGRRKKMKVLAVVAPHPEDWW